MIAGGLTIGRGGVLIDGGVLAVGAGAWGLALVLSGFMDSGAVFFSGLAVAAEAGDGGGFSGPDGAIFCRLAGVCAEECFLESVPLRG